MARLLELSSKRFPTVDEGPETRDPTLWLSKKGSVKIHLVVVLRRFLVMLVLS